ncbi:MAG: four helix bundle protein [bacterium]
MTEEELKKRTKNFSLRIIKLANALPKNSASRIIGDQLIRCGTSVGANYRVACRSRSKAEFIAKLGTVIEEADESGFWLEIIIESGLMKNELASPLLKEADEITAIMVSSRKSSCKNNNEPKSKI